MKAFLHSVVNYFSQDDVSFYVTYIVRMWIEFFTNTIIAAQG